MQGANGVAGRPLGVGFVGAGAVVQSIHLPTLARMPELFAVRHIFDADVELAAQVAAPSGARSSGNIDELLDDENVEVVVIASPARFHAAQVLSAIQAGKRAILCEKPFADSAEQARELAHASMTSGVPVIVGAMHTYDPVWMTARERKDMQPGRIRAIRSRISLPPNSGFEDAAAEVIRPPRPPFRESLAESLHGAVMGLAVHDLPLIRELVGDWTDTEVVSARAVRPGGYAIDVRVGTVVVQLVGYTGAPWKPEWALDVFGDESNVHATFPPSYVHVGSASVRAAQDGSEVALGQRATDGYDGEWHYVHAAALDPASHLANVAGLADDLDFAVRIADGAVARYLDGISA